MFNLIKVAGWSIMVIFFVWIVGVLFEKKSEDSPEALTTRIRKSGF